MAEKFVYFRSQSTKYCIYRRYHSQYVVVLLTYFQILFIFPLIIKSHVIISLFCVKAGCFQQIFRDNPCGKHHLFGSGTTFFGHILAKLSASVTRSLIVTFRHLAFPYFDSCHIQKMYDLDSFSKRNGG